MQILVALPILRAGFISRVRLPRLCSIRCDFLILHPIYSGADTRTPSEPFHKGDENYHNGMVMQSMILICTAS